MEWIHCNHCCKQPRSRDPEFIMTTCGHIFCKQCESRGNIEQCLVCKAKCKATPLARNLKPGIRVYFEDLDKKFNALSELASSLNNVYKFQKNHRLNFFKKQARRVDAYNHLKQENELLRKKLVELQKQVQTLKRKEHNQLLHQQTPKTYKESPHPRASGHTSVSLSNPRTPAEDVYDNSHVAFGFIQPHLKNHASYRNNSQRTPAYNPSLSTSGSAASSTFVNEFQRQITSSGFARPHETPNFQKGSQRGPTPLNNAMKGMRINDAAMRRNRK